MRKKTLDALNWGLKNISTKVSLKTLRRINENYGIFVFGVGFFFRQTSTFNYPFLKEFFYYHSKGVVVLSLKLKIEI